MDDWWRQYQSGDTEPWDQEKWGEAAIAEAEAIVRQTPEERAEAELSTSEAGTRLAPYQGPTQTWTRPDGTRVTEPIPPTTPVDPVRGLRLYIQRIRDRLGDQETKP